MTTTSLSFAPVEANGTTGAKGIVSPLTILSRIGALLASGSRRRADQAVGRFIQNNGGVLTDELERVISRRFGRMAGE